MENEDVNAEMLQAEMRERCARYVEGGRSTKVGRLEIAEGIRAIEIPAEPEPWVLVRRAEQAAQKTKVSKGPLEVRRDLCEAIADLKDEISLSPRPPLRLGQPRDEAGMRYDHLNMAINHIQEAISVLSWFEPNTGDTYGS